MRSGWLVCRTIRTRKRLGGLACPTTPRSTASTHAAVVATLDLRPVVDDPYTYGAIAANAIRKGRDGRGSCARPNIGPSRGPPDKFTPNPCGPKRCAKRRVIAAGTPYGMRTIRVMCRPGPRAHFLEGWPQHRDSSLLTKPLGTGTILSANRRGRLIPVGSNRRRSDAGESPRIKPRFAKPAPRPPRDVPLRAPGLWEMARLTFQLKADRRDPLLPGARVLTACVNTAGKA